jgi:hypothetical protein
MYSLDLHGLIASDYNEAYLWYENQQAGLGEQFIIEVRSMLQKISTAPEAYGEKSKRNYREVSINKFPFQIVYIIYKKEKRVFISSLHHEKKHPHNKYRR